MAGIVFNSEKQTAAVSGSERYHAADLCQDAFLRDFGGETAAHELLRPHLPSDIYDASDDIVRIYLRGSPAFGGGELDIDGTVFDVRTFALNSALKSESGGVRLLARLHSQCELHCWVDAPNRGWLADVVESGIAEGVLRDGAGWQDVASLLRQKDDGPVVCSYGGSEDFPNFGMLPDKHRLKKRQAAGEDIDALLDVFDLMRERTQWRECMAGLRAAPGRLELKPEDWDDYHISHGITALRLAEALRSNS